MEWQPIETAPKDWQEILVRGQDGVAVASWDSDDGFFISDLRGKGNGQYVVRPTHWMPLPAPPTKGEV